MSNPKDMRSVRKLDHIRYSLSLQDDSVTSGLDELYLLHQAVPELDLAEIDLRCKIGEKSLAAPIIINAMTGGSPQTLSINRALARVARELKIAMAVGSQTAALDNSNVRDTFEVVRQENPDGVIMANVSALTPPEKALEAVEMVQADLLQVHLNIPHELAMTEGDRKFRGILDNLEHISARLPVPVVAKEVGFGLSGEIVKRLSETGIQWVDIGGRGGTNFIKIENQRGTPLFGPSLQNWGIPTAVSLLETVVLGLPLKITATGGIRCALDIAKVLALGADLAGIAGSALRILLQGSAEALQQNFERMLYELRCIFLMTGARNLDEIKQKPVIIMGRTREWLEQRGIDTTYYARRGFLRRHQKNTGC